DYYDVDSEFSEEENQEDSDCSDCDSNISKKSFYEREILENDHEEEMALNELSYSDVDENR
ncbi:hypothetical protein, partial [Listeria monocytogenes]|uniref:hypothetical protein n=1 Tax=Listeria monocytogenes TaxID=1639 RepID=UPI002FDC6A99